MFKHAARSYPRYESIEIEPAGRKLEKEELTPGHVRLYFPDLNGQLRLVLINDGEHNQHLVIEESILCQAFGVSYQALKIEVNGYIKVTALEHCNVRPAVLYPENPPPAATPEITSPLPELPPVTREDAWI